MRLTTFDRCVAYAAFVAGVGGIVVQVAGMVAEHAATLASPHVAQWAHTEPSRAELRQAEVASSLEGQIETASLPAYVPDAPPLPLPILAAQMDLAEIADVKKVKRSRRARPAVASARPEGRSAADVFGRNFGVLLVASR